MHLKIFNCCCPFAVLSCECLVRINLLLRDGFTKEDNCSPASPWIYPNPLLNNCLRALRKNHQIRLTSAHAYKILLTFLKILMDFQIDPS